MWLCIMESISGRPYFDTYRTRRWQSYNYPIDRDGEWIVDRWHLMQNEAQALQSGILADWIDDHFDDLVADAYGPSDPAVRLRQLVEYLRSRFNSVYENSK